jgi:hypothetical protein
VTWWFGNSWGAPCCDPEEHIETPVGEKCPRCGELIGHLDQGVTMTLVPLSGPATLIHTHLDCFLKQILPHGPDCKRCRGRERRLHKMDCAYRRHGGECECITTPGGEAAR